jgi:hypothetical protein
MRLQGALTALVSKLETADAFHGQLDVMDTICKLLLRNRESQLEFDRIGGYSILTRFLSRLDSEQVLSLMFASVLRLLLDGHSEHLLSNLACVNWILDLLGQQQHPHILRLSVLRCIRNLLALNPLNAVVFVHCNGAAMAVESLLKEPDETLQSEAEAILILAGLRLGRHDSIIGDRMPNWRLNRWTHLQKRSPFVSSLASCALVQLFGRLVSIHSSPSSANGFVVSYVPTLLQIAPRWTRNVNSSACSTLR